MFERLQEIEDALVGQKEFSERVRAALDALPDNDLLCLVGKHRFFHAFELIPGCVGSFHQVRSCKHCALKELVG